MKEKGITPPMPRATEEEEEEQQQHVKIVKDFVEYNCILNFLDNSWFSPMQFKAGQEHLAKWFHLAKSQSSGHCQWKYT